MHAAAACRMQDAGCWVESVLHIQDHSPIAIIVVSLSFVGIFHLFLKGFMCMRKVTSVCEGAKLNYPRAINLKSSQRKKLFWNDEKKFREHYNFFKKQKRNDISLHATPSYQRTLTVQCSTIASLIYIFGGIKWSWWFIQICLTLKCRATPCNLHVHKILLMLWVPRDLNSDCLLFQC